MVICCNIGIWPFLRRLSILSACIFFINYVECSSVYDWTTYILRFLSITKCSLFWSLRYLLQLYSANLLVNIDLGHLNFWTLWDPRLFYVVVFFRSLITQFFDTLTYSLLVLLWVFWSHDVLSVWQQSTQVTTTCISFYSRTFESVVLVHWTCKLVMITSL